VDTILGTKQGTAGLERERAGRVKCANAGRIRGLRMGLGAPWGQVTMAKRQKIGKAPRNSTPHPKKKSRFLQ